MRLSASFSSAVRPVIWGEPRPATVLGTSDAALYLHAGDVVVAVVTADAVRLPCALVLPESSARLPLRSLAPDDTVAVGAGQVCWVTGGEPVDVSAVREWAPPRVLGCAPDRDRVRELDAALLGAVLGFAPALTDGLTAGPDAAGGEVVGRLLGRGPGLTPAGDDALAGYLLAGRAFGLDLDAVTARIAGLAATRTTALSAALLRHAAAGECAPEVAAVLRAMGRPASMRAEIAALLQIGHTSGAALAHGIARAAARLAAVECNAVRVGQ